MNVSCFGKGKFYSDRGLKEKMYISTSRRYFNKVAMIVAALSGAPRLLAQAPGAGKSSNNATADRRRNSRIHDGIYYFPGIGSNSGYPREDRILVTDEKHVTRTMDALKKSLELAGCTMDSILHLEVFTCLPHSDKIPMPTGQAKFEAYTAQYQALNKSTEPISVRAGLLPGRTWLLIGFLAIRWLRSLGVPESLLRRRRQPDI